jgi:hypothetical protein
LEGARKERTLKKKATKKTKTQQPPLPPSLSKNSPTMCLRATTTSTGLPAPSGPSCTYALPVSSSRATSSVATPRRPSGAHSAPAPEEEEAPLSPEDVA